MQVLSIQGWTAACAARGVERTVNLALILADDVQPGMYVLVHRDLAMRTLTAEEAEMTWAALDEALALDEAPAPSSSD